MGVSKINIKKCKKLVDGARILAVVVMALTFLCLLHPVNAQPKEVYVSGTDFIIYTDIGLAFQSHDDQMIMEIEILEGDWVGENCRLGVTERGGELYWEPNATCRCYFQLTNYYDLPIRIIYEGFPLDPLYPGQSYNGTFGNDGPAYIHWSWGFPTVIEENWTVLMGIFGVGLLLVGLLLMAYLIRTYPLFSFTREILFDKISFVISIVLIIIGAGFIMMWLMA